jgi:hypothetical protein
MIDMSKSVIFRNFSDPNTLETVFNTTWSSVWSTQAILFLLDNTLLSQCVTFTPPAMLDLQEYSLNLYFEKTIECEAFVIEFFESQQSIILLQLTWLQTLYKKFRKGTR